MSDEIIPRGPVRAVGKAMELLDTLTARREGLRLQELCRLTGYPKSTVHAILSTLREYRMVEQTGDGRYRLGIRLYECGCAVASAWDVKTAARPFLEKLASLTGGGAFLSVRSEDHVISIDSCSAQTGTGLQVAAETGVPLPLHATAQGKVLLSRQSEAEVLRYVRSVGLAPYTRHTITRPELLLEDLARVREQGYAVEDGEYRVGLRAAAAPVLDSEGKLCCVIGVVGLFGRVWAEDFQAAAQATVEMASGLSRALGWKGPRA